MPSFKVISDTHLEFHKDKGKEFITNLPSDADILVIAGDFCNDSERINLIVKLMDKFKYVIYVCGNHDYYYSRKEKTHETLIYLVKEFEGRFYWLNNDRIEIDGQGFIGCTLWWSRNIPGLRDMPYKLNDYQKIKDYHKWVHDDHDISVRYLEENIKEGDVVVTHFAPSPRSSVYYNSSLLKYYTTDLRELIEKTKPMLWIHGHTHDSSYYQIGDTMIYCNPMGYINELNPNFREDEVFHEQGEE